MLWRSSVIAFLPFSAEYFLSRIACISLLQQARLMAILLPYLNEGQIDKKKGCVSKVVCIKLM